MVGCVPPVTWTTERSWMFVRAPTRMKWTSPRSTEPNHTEASSAISTSPTTTASSTTNADAWTLGVLPPKGRMIAISRHLARGTRDASPRSPHPQGDGHGCDAEGGADGVRGPVAHVGRAVRDEGLVDLVGGAVDARKGHGDEERPPRRDAAREQREREQEPEASVLRRVERLVPDADREVREGVRLRREVEDQRQVGADRGPGREPHAGRRGHARPTIS